MFVFIERPFKKPMCVEGSHEEGTGTRPLAKKKKKPENFEKLSHPWKWG